MTLFQKINSDNQILNDDCDSNDDNNLLDIIILFVTPSR